ncbi:MAG: hypothetical protein V1902_01330 [Candidatus Falkowbacteria bacterium]
MKNVLKKYFVICAAMLLFANSAFAANIFVENDGNNIFVGDEVELRVFLDTTGIPANAIEGSVAIVPADFLKVAQIHTGGSMINFWINQPRFANGKISFSGITPGGFAGKYGLLFTIEAQAIKSGTALLKFSDVSVLANDGNGTSLPVLAQSFSVEVAQQKKQAEQPVGEVVPEQPISQIAQPFAEKKGVDKIPPELFTLEIAQDETAFEGKYFLAFAAQDKDSGVAYYQVLEKRLIEDITKMWKIEDWHTVNSGPYVLRDQMLKSNIFVRAIDFYGNARVEEKSATNNLALYEKNWFWAIILLAAAGGGRLCKIRKKKKHACR